MRVIKRKLWKRAVVLLIILGMLAQVIAVMPSQVQADTGIPDWEVKEVSGDFGSEHDYADNTFTEWVYTSPAQAEYLKINFTTKSELESGYDYVYIITESGMAFRRDGDLSGVSITVKGESFRLVLKTDRSQTYYGFDAIVSEGDAGDVSYTTETPQGALVPDGSNTPLFTMGWEYDEDEKYIIPEEIKTLNWSGMNLTSVPDLSLYTNLKELNLYNNEINSLEGVKFPSNLEKLYLGANQINSLEGVTFPSDLERLDLYDNEIKSLQDTIFPESITYLNMGKNRLPFSSKDSIYEQLSTLINGGNAEVYIGYQGPSGNTARSESVWFGYYDDQQVSYTKVYKPDEDEISTDYMDIDTEYPLEKNSLYVVYIEDGAVTSFYNLDSLEEQYSFLPGETGIQAEFGAAALRTDLLEEEKASDDVIKSEVRLSLAKITDESSILSFWAELDKINIKRVYDLGFEEYTDIQLDPEILSEEDIAGVPCLIPLTDGDAAKNLKLTADAQAVAFQIITKERQKYLSFTLTKLGSYRLYEETPATGDDTITTDTPGQSGSGGGTLDALDYSGRSVAAPSTGDTGMGVLWLGLSSASLMVLGELNRRRRNV